MRVKPLTLIFSRSWVWLSLVAMSGCQGGLARLPSLGSLNNPSRVPPPASGSFQVPANYTDPSGGGATAKRPPTTTLGQLRSIETGKSGSDKIGADGVVASEPVNRSFSIPVVAEAVTTLQTSANQFNRSLDGASAAFAKAVHATNSSMELGAIPVRAGSTISDNSENGPAVIQASAIQVLPDPQYNEAASHGTIRSDESVKWKSSQR